LSFLFSCKICTKRGPLGACLKTELRTKDNDNDVANKYFRDPSVLIQRQKTAILQSSDDVDSNELIQKLRQQSVDNREKNELYVARKTFEADQVRTLFICRSTISCSPRFLPPPDRISMALRTVLFYFFC
jgi:hypothetical protein